jgi:competence protein ComEC
VKAYYESRHIYGYIKADTYQVVDARYNLFKQKIWEVKQILAKSLEKITDSSGILKSVLLGDREELSEEISDIYQSSGIAHLLSVSGLHISLLGMGLYKILKKLLRNRAFSAGISIFVMGCYCIMVGSRPASIRAVLGFILCLTAELLGRNYDMATSTALAGIVILWQSPSMLFQSGFQYSFLAVLAISLVTPVIVHRFWITDSRVVSVIFGITLQLVMLPSILYHQYTWPLYGVILNLVVIPLLSLVVLSGFSGAVLGLVHVKIGKIVVLPAHWILKFYEKAGSFTMKLPYAQILTGKPSLWQIGIYVGVLLVLWILWEKKRRQLRFFVLERQKDLRQVMVAFYLFGGIYLGTVFLHHIRYTGLEISFLDVGQGDGIVCKLPNGKVIAIDGGSSSNSQLGEYVLEPFFKASGVEKVDAWFISHPDNDHYSGFMQVLKSGYSIGKVYVSESVRQDELVEEMEAYHKVDFVEKGEKFTVGEVVIEVLHPNKNYQTEDSNNTSIVLQMDYHGFRALFMGDLGSEAEGEVETKDVDVLKVAHHGSKYSTSTEWLEKVNPKMAIISAGKNNRYGHPHEELLERLEEVGSVIRRTDEEGEVVVKVK